MDLVNIFIKGVFIENMIFAYFLGMCSYLAVSKTVTTANGLGLAVIFVLAITVPVNYILENSISKPNYKSLGPSGIDLSAGISSKTVIEPEKFKIIPTGIILEIPSGYEGQIRSRSGLASKNGIVVLNSPGTIDYDYRGEIKVILINLGNKIFEVLPGMRIAQLVIAEISKVKINYVEKIITTTKRGEKGFGSTGL